MEGGTGADTIDGGAGTDTIGYAASAVGVSVNLQTGGGLGGDAQGDVLSLVENINGSGHGDSLTGDGASNVLSGLGGNDTLDGGAGVDTLTGGAGDDTYLVDETGDRALELANEGVDTVLAYTNYTLGAHLENLTAAGAGGWGLTGNELGNVLSGNEGDNDMEANAGNDTLYGGGGNDTLSGGEGDDALSGGVGQDFLDGGAGADTLAGGAGNDTYLVVEAGDVVTELANEGVDTVEASAMSYTLGANVENLTLKYAAVYGTGNALANVITGTDAHNVLDGGEGADTIDGGAGRDMVTYANATSGKFVHLWFQAHGGGPGQEDVLRSIEDVTGSNYNDNIAGDEFANMLDGGGGNDFMEGGGGADTINGGAGIDTVGYAASAAAVTVNLESGAGQGGDAQGDMLHELENIDGSSHGDTLTGNAEGNVLSGFGGNDTLDGREGDDTLIGGAGNDTLIGGAGNDTYLVGRGGGADSIVEYDPASTADKLVFSLTGGAGGRIDFNQLWLTREQGTTNLDITVMGTGDHVKVMNWYGGYVSQLDAIVAANGEGVERTLVNANVDQLVQAMAQMAPPSGATSWAALSSAQQSHLQFLGGWT